MSGYEIPTKVRALVNARSQGWCERCAGLGTELHHRKRGNPRLHWVQNLVRLCPACHRWATTAPPAAVQDGLVLRGQVTEEIAAAAPLALLGRVWVLLTPAAEYTIGGVTFGHIGQVWQALETMRVEGVGPADPATGAGQPSVPAPRVGDNGPLGKRRARYDIDETVRAPSLPAGFLVRRGEHLGDLGTGEFEEL